MKEFEGESRFAGKFTYLPSDRLLPLPPDKPARESKERQPMREMLFNR